MPFDNPSVGPDVRISHRDEQELLGEMRHLLRTPSNWVKGTEESHGRFCLVGALNAASMDWPDYHRRLIARRVWERLVDIIDGEPIAFNDADDTRHRDILSLLTKARCSFE